MIFRVADAQPGYTHAATPTNATSSAICAETRRQGRRIRWRWLLSTFVVWILAVAIAALCWFSFNHGIHGLDSRVYWEAPQESNPYQEPPGAQGAYLYAPPFRLLMFPFAKLPMGVFIYLWMALEAVAFLWLLKPLGWRWGVPAFLACTVELAVGNIHAFLAVALVVGLRRPAAWALPALTKVTSAIGLLWFVARGQWRAAAIACGVTASIALLTAGIAPAQWQDWLEFLIHHRGSGQMLFPVRVLSAAALAVLASRRGKPWLLSPALILSQPVVEWMSLTLLTAIPRLRAAGAESDVQMVSKADLPCPA